MFHKKHIGNLGEGFAASYLEKKGHKILDRNYSRKWGELDIVSREPSGVVHFVEVKTVTRVTVGGRSAYTPEENVHLWKRQRLSRIIQTYLLDKKIGENPWQVDILSVYIDKDENLLGVEVLEDVIL